MSGADPWWVSTPAVRKPPPPERIAAVRRGHACGQSLGQMANSLGVTKGTVAGLVRRHVQGKFDRVHHQKSKGVLPHKPKQKPPKAPAKPPVVQKPVIVPPPPVVLAPSPPAPPGSMSMGCRWTDCEGRPWVFCDQPVKPGTAWCPAHHKRVYAGRGASL
jgi:hypothetical protein